jgi:hypothetical protein
MEFDKVLSDILEVKKPWFIREIDVHKGTKRVNVFIDFQVSQLRASMQGAR